MFRDNFPQHHLARKDHWDDGRFPSNFVFDPKLVQPGKCGGPFLDNVNPAIYANRTRYHVPVIHIVDDPIWQHAWNWHADSDCMHYCSDPVLWETLHWKLIHTVGNYLK